MFFVMMLRYPGVMIDLPVYLFFGRAGVVIHVPIRFDGGSCTPPLPTDATWDSGRVLLRLLRDRASTSFLTTGSSYVCIHTISRSI